MTSKRQFLKQSLAAGTILAGTSGFSRALANVAAVSVGENETPRQGWIASPSVVARYEERAKRRDFKVIYREEHVPDFKLPDPLAMNNGLKVADAGTWWQQRRPEILELFRKNVHGRAPIGRPMTADSLLSERLKDALPEIISRGYALAIIDREGIDPDEHDGFKNGVHGTFDPPGERPDDAWGTISAWAWGLSRALDYLETDEHVNAERVAVMGVSRAGKTALWAGAQDERFTMTISICSGCTGAALSRRRFGEPVGAINGRFPHWFCRNYRQFDWNEDALPVDQHMLLSLVAPRLLYVSSADEDLWADPRGEFLGAKHADPVYQLLGAKGLDAEYMPTLESPVHTGRIAYHIRRGGHGLELYDWLRYLDFADRHWN